MDDVRRRLDGDGRDLPTYLVSSKEWVPRKGDLEGLVCAMVQQEGWFGIMIRWVMLKKDGTWVAGEKSEQ